MRGNRRSNHEKAFDIDSEVLVERYIKGKELTVAVIGDAEVEALPIIEIVPKSDFYDFESKYAPGGSQHLCPAPLSDETTRMVQELAVRAHRALSCEGVSRSDFILEEDGSCWTLETNTIPGMTGTIAASRCRACGGHFFSGTLYAAYRLCPQLINGRVECFT